MRILRNDFRPARTEKSEDDEDDENDEIRQVGIAIGIHRGIACHSTTRNTRNSAIRRSSERGYKI